MRREKEIMCYLGIDESCKNFEWYDKVLETAFSIEKKYRNQLAFGVYGYGLLGDFESTPDRLEDTNIWQLQKVEEIDGIVVYHKIEV